jgi:hypothetical protein
MQVLVDHLDDFVGEMRSPGLLVEVGCGAAPSATLLSRLAPSAAVMGVDISLSAMRAARELTSASHAEVHLARMDLLAALRPASVDLLVFMPPYVPSTEAAFAEAMSSASSVETPVDSLEQAAWVWSGGPGGLAILERLVSRDLDRVLAERGRGDQTSLQRRLHRPCDRPPQRRSQGRLGRWMGSSANRARLSAVRETERRERELERAREVAARGAREGRALSTPRRTPGTVCIAPCMEMATFGLRGAGLTMGRQHFGAHWP